MKGQNPILLICVLTANTQIVFSAGPSERGKQVELHWSELGTFLTDGDMKVVLPGGVFVQGQMLGVTTGELAIRVTKSSDKTKYPKGRGVIPRSSVTTISFTQTKGAAGRLVLTLAVVFGGLGVGALYAMSHEDRSASGGEAAALLALPIGAGVAGYCAGRPIDRKTTLIKVLPD